MKIVVNLAIYTYIHANIRTLSVVSHPFRVPYSIIPIFLFVDHIDCGCQTQLQTGPKNISENQN